MRKHFTQTAVILAAVSAIGLTACTQGSASAPIPDTIKVENVKDNVITVQSTEEVKVVPDMAELVFSVTTQAADANTTITVSDIPIDQAGTLISSSVEAGINSISQVTYLSSKYDETYQQALKNAIASAKVKAEAIAEAGGCTLGPVVHVEEYNDNQIARYSTYKNAATEDMAAGAASMSVEPGQLSVEARVTVEFEIQ